MQSAENKAYVDSKIAVRRIWKRALLKLANRIKQVPDSFIKRLLQEVYRKVCTFSSAIEQFLTSQSWG